MKRVVAAGAIAAVVAIGLLAFAAHAIRLPEPDARRSRIDKHSTSGLTALLENYDGGDYAAIARDPTLARPEIYPTRAAAAYREQRPLFGELAWAGSLGDPARVPITLAGLAVLAAAFGVMAIGALLVRRGISPFFALAAFALPGVLSIVYDMMPELFQLGLITFGLLAWEKQSRTSRRWAVVWFTLAALTRESSLLVPLVLVVMELPRIRSRETRRAILPLAIPFAAYVSWITFIRLRVGAWPFDARSGRLTTVPFGGLVHTFQHSPDRMQTLMWFVLAAVVFAYALARGRRDAWYGTMIAFAVMGVFLGWSVWQRPDYFGRVLLPLYVYSGIVLGSALFQEGHSVTLRRASSPLRRRVS